MKNYTMVCVSGAVVLVRAASAEEAEAAWDEAVRDGAAEERVAGTTERATREDVAACVAAGHDYR